MHRDSFSSTRRLIVPGGRGTVRQSLVLLARRCLVMSGAKLVSGTYLVYACCREKQLIVSGIVAAKVRKPNDFDASRDWSIAMVPQCLSSSCAELDLSPET